MLLQLTVTHYAIARALEHTFSAGMTAITGETGAGKSILLDALGLALGDRADIEAIASGQERADICASFDISHHNDAQQWLRTHDFPENDDQTCLLKRVLAREGRSRAYINGQPATLQQLRELGDWLIDIHSQHEHQSLLHKDTHRRLLDEFGGHAALAQQLRDVFIQWQQLAIRLRALRDQSEEHSARVQLLKYQVDELDKVAAQPLEAEQLDKEYKQLMAAESQIEDSAAVLRLCAENEEFNARQTLAQALHLLQHNSTLAEQLPSVAEMLTNASIQIEEAVNDLQRYRDRIVVDPERLQQVEQRQHLLFEVARKHRVTARELPTLHQQLSSELATLTGGTDTLAKLGQALAALENQYQKVAVQLSKKRQKAAKTLAHLVQEQLQILKMEHCIFEVALNPVADSQPALHGLEQVEYLISTQPDAPPRALAKIASGGELSRISLAIQVVTARTSRIPTLVFDEVDVGIGGATAIVVGDLLKQLGARGQVLCVTHQAQVAARAHHHLHVSKQLNGRQMETQLQTLNGEQRVAEIARMIDGEDTSQHSRAHAKEMLMSSVA